MVTIRPARRSISGTAGTRCPRSYGSVSRWRSVTVLPSLISRYSASPRCRSTRVVQVCGVRSGVVASSAAATRAHHFSSCSGSSRRNVDSSGVVITERNSSATIRLGTMQKSSSKASNSGALASRFCRVTTKMSGFIIRAVTAMARFFTSRSLPATMPTECSMPASRSSSGSVPVPSTVTMPSS